MEGESQKRRIAMSTNISLRLNDGAIKNKNKTKIILYIIAI